NNQLVFIFQAEDGIRDFHVTGVQTCALPIFQLVGDALAKADGTLGGMSVSKIAEIELTEFGVPTEIPKVHIVKYAADGMTVVNEIGRASCRERVYKDVVAGPDNIKRVCYKYR